MKRFLAKIRNRFLAPVTGKVDEIDRKIEQVEQAVYLFRDSAGEGLVRRIDEVAAKAYAQDEQLQAARQEQKKQVLAQAGLYSGDTDALFSAYLGLMDHTEEYRLFNDIPVEYYCKLVKADRAPLFLGNHADLCVKELGAGDAFRPVTGLMAQPAPSGAFLCSPSLLPDYMGRRDMVVITNPSLAQVLLHADGLLDRVRDLVDNALIFPAVYEVPPFLMLWDRNFSLPEWDGAAWFRWAIGFDEDSSFTLVDFKGGFFGKPVRLSFDVASVHDGGTLTVSAFGSTQSISLSGGMKHLELSGVMQSAKETVVFAFQGENRFAGQDVRPLKFRVCGMRLEADGVEPLTQAEIYGTEHNFMAASQRVHSCLHRHGFFTVASALCVNRGWFSQTELVSDYYMGDHYLQRMNRQEEAVDYILENRFDRVAFLYTAYRKAKKEEYDG